MYVCFHMYKDSEGICDYCFPFPKKCSGLLPSAVCHSYVVRKKKKITQKIFCEIRKWRTKIKLGWVTSNWNRDKQEQCP